MNLGKDGGWPLEMLDRPLANDKIESIGDEG